MWDLFQQLVWSSTMWTAKTFGLPEDKIALAQIEIDKHLDETTLSGQISTIYNKYKSKIQTVLICACIIGGIYFYNKYLRRR